MALLNMRKDLVTFYIVGILALAIIPKHVIAKTVVVSQTCVAASMVFCLTGEDYCGTGCKEGPCASTRTPTNDVSVGGIVTAEFFNGIKNQADASCAGKSFYTRDAFLNAPNSYPESGRTGSADDSEREIAAFFAHVTHETGDFCYVEEIENQMPTVIRQTGSVVSFKTALWFWMTNVHSVVNQGFGATIQKVNGPLECDGKYPDKVQARIGYNNDHCNKFGVAPGGNLPCYMLLTSEYFS